MANETQGRHGDGPPRPTDGGGGARPPDAVVAEDIVFGKFADRRHTTPVFYLFLAWIVFCSWRDLGWRWIVPGAVGWMAAHSIVRKRRVLAFRSGCLLEHTLWFGCWHRGTRTIPFPEFAAIVCRADSGTEGEAPRTEVGMRHADGTWFWLRTFGIHDGRADREAEEFAWRISCGTGIGIENRPGE